MCIRDSLETYQNVSPDAIGRGKKILDKRQVEPTPTPEPTPDVYECLGLIPCNYSPCNSKEFATLFFSDALRRYPKGRSIVCKMWVQGDRLRCEKQEAHRHPDFLPESANYYSPFLYDTQGKYKGKGIRTKDKAVCAFLLVLDFDSRTQFDKAERQRINLGLPEWDFFIFTGGRGVQAGWYIDVYPLYTPKQRDFFLNVWRSLVQALGADPKAVKLSQLLRLPSTVHPKTGLPSHGYYRDGYKDNCKGKLSWLANILKAKGLLQNTPTKTQGLGLKREREGIPFKPFKPFKESRETLKKFFAENPTYEGTYRELEKLLGIPATSIRHLALQYQARGMLALDTLRGNQGKTRHKTKFTWQGSPVNTGCLQNNISTFVLRDGIKFKDVLTEYLSSGAVSGYRNTTLFSLALFLYALGEQFESAKQKIWAGNGKSLSPLCRGEFDRTLDSAYSGRYHGPSLDWLNECCKGVGLGLGEAVESESFEFKAVEAEVEVSNPNTNGNGNGNGNGQGNGYTGTQAQLPAQVEAEFKAEVSSPNGNVSIQGNGNGCWDVWDRVTLSTLKDPGCVISPMISKRGKKGYVYGYVVSDSGGAFTIERKHKFFELAHKRYLQKQNGNGNGNGNDSQRIG